MTTPPRNRRWFQFRLRTLLILTAVVGVVLSAVAVPLYQVRSEQSAATAIRKLGGYVRWDSRPSAGLVSRMLAWKFPQTVVDVSMTHEPLTGSDLLFLKNLPNLDTLCLQGAGTTDADLQWLAESVHPRDLTLYAAISDDGMKHLGRMTSIERLHVSSDTITDDGLQYLPGMQSLRTLSVEGTHITDRGFVHIGKCVELNGLCLYKTSATGAGLGHLAELKRLHSLCVLEDQIDDVWAQNARCISTLRDLQLNVRSMTDKGLADLASLNELVALHLHEMDRTTDEGLSRLSALKNLKFLTVSGSRVTDHSLEVLSKIPSLYSLWLENTSVTDEGMRKFQQRFPKRHVSR